MFAIAVSIFLPRNRIVSLQDSDTATSRSLASVRCAMLEEAWLTLLNCVKARYATFHVVLTDKRSSVARIDVIARLMLII